MSYIINNTGAFINTKLTETGRRKLAEGKLNFTAWSIGDSEINYNREAIVDEFQSNPSLSGSSRILRPFDRQPNITSFITTDGNTTANILTPNQINTIKAVISNKADERGFFSGSTSLETLLTNTYVNDFGIVNNSLIDGTNQLEIGTGVTYNIGDLVLLKFTNDSSGNVPVFSNDEPLPNLWYKIQASGSTYVVLDRDLPILTGNTTDTSFIIYPQGETYEAFGEGSTLPYWDTNTLSFNGCCDISCGDVPVWNMNNVWCENIIGMTGSSINNTTTTPNESYEKFGSWNYLGQKYPFLNYSCISDDELEASICDEPGSSVLDSVKKSISIIHYTNNTISNFYGEFLFIDDTNGKILKIDIPTLMYHRRDFSTSSGTTIGMSFISSGQNKFITDSDISYFDLIEDPSLIDSNLVPKVVGKVFPQQKMVVIDDDEIVAAISYKSNRNWTLPPLSANLVASQSGGVLAPNEVMWLTYALDVEDNNGIRNSLPCQYYTKMVNNTSTNKDVQFKISNIDLLPYMRKIEDINYDGFGFYADRFKIIYQILPLGERPLSDNWLVHDFTSNSITNSPNETIDPTLLENQNPTVNGFTIDIPTIAGDTTYSIMASLNMPSNSTPNLLQFGDERFFYGNLNTDIGATIFKTIFRLNVSADLFKFTDNPTRDEDVNNILPTIKVSECGIYDSAGDLVMISKLSRPIKLTPGNTILLELSMDF